MDSDNEVHSASTSDSEMEPLLDSQSLSDHRQGAAFKMSSTPKILPQYVTALCVTMGAVAMGSVLGYSSPAGLLLMNSTNSNINLTMQQNSWFSSSSNLGALIGSPIAGFCIDNLGRRGTMIYLIAPFMIGWALIIAAQNFAMLLLGRILTGLCCGFVSVSVPTYIGEYASPHIRGTLGAGFQLMVTIGILFSYCMGAAFDNFRWIAAVCAILPCIFSVGMIFNKESPNYLLSRGRDEDAKTAMNYFRGNNYRGTENELETLKKSLEQKQQRNARLSDFKSPYILKPFMMSVGLMFFQQFSGINAVLFNLDSIFEESGSDISTTLSSIIVGVVQVLATLVGALLMDKAGRKMLLIISATFMIISLVPLGTYFYLKETNPEVASTIGWLPLVSLVAFNISFAIGYGPIPWLMMGELFSPDIKELAGSIAALVNWSFAFITTLMFSPLQKVIHSYGVYWMFAGFCVINLVFVITFVYETKGKTLQEITAHFGGPQIDYEEKKKNLAVPE